MSKDSINAANELINKYQNPYLIAAALGAKARKKADDVDNVILHSEAISWVLTDKVPSILRTTNRFSHRKLYINDSVYEILSGIDDNNIRECVKCSISKSIDANNLIYVYNDLPNDNQKARVRVIVNIIWYEILNKKYGGT